MGSAPGRRGPGGRQRLLDPAPPPGPRPGKVEIMSTLIAEPPARTRRSRTVNDEKPISLKKIQSLRPDVPRWLVYYVTDRYCTPHEYAESEVEKPRPST